MEHNVITLDLIDQICSRIKNQLSIITIPTPVSVENGGTGVGTIAEIRQLVMGEGIKIPPFNGGSLVMTSPQIPNMTYDSCVVFGSNVFPKVSTGIAHRMIAIGSNIFPSLTKIMRDDSMHDYVVVGHNFAENVGVLYSGSDACIVGNNNCPANVGRYNVVVGHWNALKVSANGSIQDNVIIGSYNFQSTDDLKNCVVIGNNMAKSVTSAIDHVVMVEGTTEKVTTMNNTAMFMGNTQNATSVFDTTIVGRYAGVDAGLSQMNNCTVLGHKAWVTGNNQVVIGNSMANTYISGYIMSRGDERDMTDITTMDTDVATEFIKGLNPVKFKWDMRDDYIDPSSPMSINTITHDGTHTREREHFGFVGQQVKELADKLGVDFAGYQDHKVDGGCDVISLAYTEMIAPMIAAIQNIMKNMNSVPTFVHTVVDGQHTLTSNGTSTGDVHLGCFVSTADIPIELGKIMVNKELYTIGDHPNIPSGEPCSITLDTVNKKLSFDVGGGGKYGVGDVLSEDSIQIRYEPIWDSKALSLSRTIVSNIDSPIDDSGYTPYTYIQKELDRIAIATGTYLYICGLSSGTAINLIYMSIDNPMENVRCNDKYIFILSGSKILVYDWGGIQVSTITMINGTPATVFQIIDGVPYIESPGYGNGSYDITIVDGNFTQDYYTLTLIRKNTSLGVFFPIDVINGIKMDYSYPTSLIGSEFNEKPQVTYNGTRTLLPSGNTYSSPMYHYDGLGLLKATNNATGSVSYIILVVDEQNVVNTLTVSSLDVIKAYHNHRLLWKNGTQYDLSSFSNGAISSKATNVTYSLTGFMPVDNYGYIVDATSGRIVKYHSETIQNFEIIK